MDTICEPNIMTLAQEDFEIFCSQGSYAYKKKVKKKTSKKGYNCNDKSDGKERKYASS